MSQAPYPSIMGTQIHPRSLHTPTSCNPLELSGDLNDRSKAPGLLPMAMPSTSFLYWPLLCLSVFVKGFGLGLACATAQMQLEYAAIYNAELSRQCNLELLIYRYLAYLPKWLWLEGVCCTFVLVCLATSVNALPRGAIVELEV